MKKTRKSKHSTRYVYLVLQTGTGRICCGFTKKQRCQTALKKLRSLGDYDYDLIAVTFNESNETRWDF